MRDVEQCGFSKPALSFLRVLTSFLTDDDDDVNGDGRFYKAALRFQADSVRFCRICDSK